MLSLFSELYTINKYYVIFHREDTGHRNTGYRNTREYKDMDYRVQGYRLQGTDYRIKDTGCGT